MGDESWDSWEATDSLLERVVQGKTARLEGTGVLELEEWEDAREESGAPNGPGSVRFALLCDFAELASLRDTIQVRIVSQDDTAFQIIRGCNTPKFSPLPSYRLSGMISTKQGQLPVQMGAVTVDARGLSLISLTEKEYEIRRVVPVGSVQIGSLTSVGDLYSCKVLMPNFVDQATVEGGGARVTLYEVSPEATERLSAPESQGKILPGCFLEVQRLPKEAGKGFELAVNDFGWLLSFYAGRRIPSRVGRRN